jgi:hypothetical protein
MIERTAALIKSGAMERGQDEAIWTPSRTAACVS